MWLRTGNVNVTNGSAVVNGGSQSPMFVTNNVLPGYAFNGPDGRRYEVLSVQSETQLTLQRNYIGATASNQSYEIEQNTGAAEADTKQRINELLTIFRTTAELTSLKVGSPTEASAVAAFLGTLVSLENSASARMRLSKGATGNDVYLEFAVGNSGRARIGLIGNNDIVVQTSPNGSSWTTRMTISSAGVVSLQGVLPIDSGGTGASSASAARGALDVPGLSVSNTFSQTQIISTLTALLTARMETAGESAFAGPQLELYRNKANLAAILDNDVGGQVLFTGKSAAGNKRTLASIFQRLVSRVDAAEIASLDIQTMENGALNTRWRFGGGGSGGGGLYPFGATDPGAGRIRVNGLRFPSLQSASADPNDLDDYEEGDWTPTLLFGGAAVDMTYGPSTSGRYVKIGKWVICKGRIALTAKGSSTGSAQISGIPYAAAAANPGSQLTVGFYGSMTSISGALSGTLAGGSLVSLRMGGAGAANNITETVFTNTSDLIFQYIYEATA